MREEDSPGRAILIVKDDDREARFRVPSTTVLRHDHRWAKS